MAYEKVTLEEMMEDVRKSRGEAPDFDLPDSGRLDAELVLEGESALPKVDIDTCIAETLKKLEVFRLTEEERKTIEEFLTFHLQTRQRIYKGQGIRPTYYNLMLVSREQEMAVKMARILRDALEIRLSRCSVVTEKELSAPAERRVRYSSETKSAIPENTEMLIIWDCQEAPRQNTDGSATARDKSAKEVEAYRNLWRQVVSYAKKRAGAILIVCCDPDVYRSSLRPNTELCRRVCSHTLFLQERTVDDWARDCLACFCADGFTVTEGFRQSFDQYFPAACRASDLSGQELVNEIVARIYARYYSRRRTEEQLTEDCVPDDDPQLRSVEEVLGQLGELVGLQGAKEEITNIYKMQVAGLTESTGYYHMLFTGNPGTGKTTVARMTADLLYSMDVIRSNKLVVTKPSDLISEWIGGTGNKAMEVIRRAYNGVLFIDEAYGIAAMDRGKELLNILIQEMENNADKLVVIFAGYTEEMRTLLKANPGLASRISREIVFEDYSHEELAEIFLMMCKKEGFTLHPDARDELDSCIAWIMTREFFGNARDIRTMLQELKEAWSDDYFALAQKYGQENVDLPREFCPRHFEKILPPKKEVSIRDLVGLEVMKRKLEDFRKQALYQKRLKEKGVAGAGDQFMHMIFTGNPGTGKTTVARLIADDLYAIGMLKTNRLVVAERKDLVSAFGNTARMTTDVIRRAVGGVLFIDEAYSLAGGMGGKECIEILLTAMEEHKGNTVFIFAGYVEQMQDFIDMNPGIQSRIGFTFHFDDYSPQELTQIYAEKMHKSGFLVSPGALRKVRGIMEYFQDMKNFGNGRFVDHVIHQTIAQRAGRDFAANYRNIQARDIPSLKTLIETAPNSMQLYDPNRISPQERRRTALHELGHALVMLHTDPENVPPRISIRNRAGSLGRVELPQTYGNRTEGQLMDRLAIYLAGKNAERLILGDHDTGCASDYARAKQLAQSMVENFAMDSFGATAEEILKAADSRSAEILEEYRQILPELADRLLEEKEITGEELKKCLK